MAKLDPAVALARLTEGCARVRDASLPDDVLDAAGEAARALAGASDHAWSAHVTHGAVVLDRPSGHRAADDAVLELALGQLTSVATVAFEAAELRARVESVVRARELLFAGVSHDLRNPLNTFAMSAGLLRDDLERNDVDAARGIGLLSRMDRAATRMQTLIEDLALASRIDARKIEIAVREQSAGQLMADAAAAAMTRAPGAPERGPAVSYQRPSDAHDVVVMADRLRTLELVSKVIAFETKCTGDEGAIVLDATREDGAVTFTARALGSSGAPVAPPEEGRGGLWLLIARGLAEAQHGALRVLPGDALVVAFTLPLAPT